MSYKPLLVPGIHDIEEKDLSNHFLSSFADSTTRKRLIEGFRKYLAALKQFGIKFEIWVDGSFTTEKPDPSDIDLVVFGSRAELNALPEQQLQALKPLLLNRAAIKLQLGCDVLFCVAEDIDGRSYWRGWYGFDRDENPKGIARLEVTP
jgi:hypothetical protein